MMFQRFCGGNENRVVPSYLANAVVDYADFRLF